jgi:pilus assembly protein CpaC
VKRSEAGQISMKTLSNRLQASTLALAVATAGPFAGLSLTTLSVSSAKAQNAQVKVRSTNSGSQRLKLGLNKSVVIDLPADAYDILVANPAVADSVTRTARRIYLFGKSVGETNIYVFGKNGEQIVSLDLSVERDVAGLVDYISRFLPNSRIQAELVNDNVVLTGTVETPLDAKRAVQLAEIFVSGGEATTGQYSQTAAGGDASGGVSIDNPDSQRRSSKIVNLIKIVGEDQVTLKVTVAEVSRTVMKQLGVGLLASGSSNGISWNAISENAIGGGPVGLNQLGITTSAIDSYLNAMEQAGVMKTLAEPTLTAVSGEQASFKVGGEFNIIERASPGGTKDDPVTLTYAKIDYGIGLDFKPVVLSPGRISLKVRTSVSEPTNEGPSISGARGTVVNGLSLRKRLADTTVELPSGGSMMIAGLVRDDVRQTASGLPGISKLPVLGTLFRSKSFVRNETELVIIVTPYLARPTARNDLARPDDNFAPPSDGASYFLGRVNRVYGTMKTDKPAGRYHGVVGYIYK